MRCENKFQIGKPSFLQIRRHSFSKTERQKHKRDEPTKIIRRKYLRSSNQEAPHTVIFPHETLPIEPWRISDHAPFNYEINL
jgi:hypothetical protein